VRDPGFYDDIPEREYHADRDSLSVSGAKVLLKAPALFRHQQENPEHKDVFDFGSAAHALVLGAGMDSIYVTPLEEFRTKEAKAEKAAAQSEGLAVVTPADWLVICDMADALSQHRLAMQLLSDGKPEVSAYALDEPTGVLRRGRFDWLGSTILTDYKTAASAEPSAFAGSAAKFGYHMQAAWYLDLAADLGHPAEAFAFIVQEKAAPYLVSVVVLDDAAVNRGRELNRQALEIFRDCHDSNLWPGYVTDSEYAVVDLPRWAYYDNEVQTA
jgi:hypothetical protein